MKAKWLRPYMLIPCIQIRALAALSEMYQMRNFSHILCQFQDRVTIPL